MREFNLERAKPRLSKAVSLFQTYYLPAWLDEGTREQTLFLVRDVEQMVSEGGKLPFGKINLPDHMRSRHAIFQTICVNILLHMLPKVVLSLLMILLMVLLRPDRTFATPTAYQRTITSPDQGYQRSILTTSPIAPRIHTPYNGSPTYSLSYPL
ncbi:hypothetical protein HD806DRAFT_332708 [Xylariaceae sp. AK1471]|nr:hypothetical protein HD806DRAFT_332708 [Xylariaceae sp. AK1471]